jgi:hypothetical protein
VGGGQGEEPRPPYKEEKEVCFSVRRLLLLAVSVLAVVSMAVSPAFAHDWDGDGCDEDFFDCYGFWAVPAWVNVEYDIDWNNDRDDVDCEVEEVDYSDVFEEVEVELDCGWE